MDSSEEERPFGLPIVDPKKKEATYQAALAYSLSRALGDTLTTTNIIDAWKTAGLYSKETLNAKIAALVPSTSDTTPVFNEEDWILVPLRTENVPQKATTRKVNLPQPPKPRRTIRRSPTQQATQTIAPPSLPAVPVTHEETPVRGTTRSGRPVTQLDLAALGLAPHRRSSAQKPS